MTVIIVQLHITNKEHKMRIFAEDLELFENDMHEVDTEDGISYEVYTQVGFMVNQDLFLHTKVFDSNTQAHNFMVGVMSKKDDKGMVILDDALWVEFVDNRPQSEIYGSATYEPTLTAEEQHYMG